MVIDIDKIIVRDRIRKDFGDIQELADDIKQNGLINPPVVNKEYELLAGERRLRACKSLGWQQIEIRMMDTRDGSHDFDVEVSENESRKDFTRTEREAIYTKRVEMKLSKSGQICPNVHEAEKEAAKELGTSRSNMNAERAIIKNKDLLTPEDFADWDEGKLSTNKAFQKIKTEQEKLKKDNEELQAFADDKEAEIEELQAKVTELENRESEVKTVEVIKEVVPEDIKRKAEMADIHEKDFKTMQKAYEEMAEKYKQSEAEKQKMIDKAQKPETKNAERLKVNAFSFCSGMSNFLEAYGGYGYLMNEINALPNDQKKAVYEGIRSIYRWANEMLNIGIEEVVE